LAFRDARGRTADYATPEAVADAEQIGGLPLERGGGGDEAEAGQRRLAGAMVFR
jgi:hypothetical protein